MLVVEQGPAGERDLDGLDVAPYGPCALACDGRRDELLLDTLVGRWR